jgi:hypothetical protein
MIFKTENDYPAYLGYLGFDKGCKTANADQNSQV